MVPQRKYKRGLRMSNLEDNQRNRKSVVVNSEGDDNWEKKHLYRMKRTGPLQIWIRNASISAQLLMACLESKHTNPAVVTENIRIQYGCGLMIWKTFFPCVTYSMPCRSKKSFHWEMSTNYPHCSSTARIKKYWFHLLLPVKNNQNHPSSYTSNFPRIFLFFLKW